MMVADPKAWAPGDKPEPYAAGSAGPKRADGLIERRHERGH